MILIKEFNSNHVRLECDRGILRELHDSFSFYANGYKFHPKFKIGMWDGMIRLVNLRNSTFPRGLLFDLMKWCKKQGYEYKVSPELKPLPCEGYLESFNKELDNLTLDPYEYQLSVFQKMISLNGGFCLSPTGSGKSFITYLLVRFLLLNMDEILGEEDTKILICVPSKTHIRQLQKDFVSYETDSFVSDEVFEMFATKRGKTDLRIVLATWDLMTNQSIEWFERNKIRCFILDEAHQAPAKSIVDLIEKLGEAPFRFGFTGTLDGTLVHEMQCRAWFGMLFHTKTTKELMEMSLLSALDITCKQLNYSDDEREALHIIKNRFRKSGGAASSYADEIKFIVNHSKRNTFIVETALSQPMNTIVLFNLVDEHGVKLYEEAKRICKRYEKEVYIITGEKNLAERDGIRTIMEKQNNVVLFATYGTMSVGINIKNLHCLILAHPAKRIIRVLQSIGRILRLSANKEAAHLIDIWDDLSWEEQPNIILNHAHARKSIYIDSGFSYKKETIKI